MASKGSNYDCLGCGVAVVKDGVMVIDGHACLRHSIYCKTCHEKGECSCRKSRDGRFGRGGRLPPNLTVPDVADDDYIFLGRRDDP